MIARELDKYIEDFYKISKKALMLTGARQTGKTFAIRKYGHQYECYVEINFLENKDAVFLMKNASGVDDLLLRISALASKRLVPEKTLIFFDEVQECPEIVTAIKFLVDDGRYRYALSGSLLGVELKDLRSEPVGYMEIKEVFPLTIFEFYRAVGVSEEVLSHVASAWERRAPVDEIVHTKLMQLLYIYLLVGGMPAAVMRYLETNDLQIVRREQNAILMMYKRDIAKYDRNNKLYLDEILSLIPSELNAKNKRFILKNLNENAKYSRYANDFLWLKNAGVALPTYNVEEPKEPLLLSECRNLFKLFQNDVGLLAAQYAVNIQASILNGDSTINFGSVYENFVAQALAANGHALYYFNSKRQGELDFVIEYEGKVLPIEVKSGKDYERHKALDNVLKNPMYGISEGVVLQNDNLKMMGKILYIPIYMVELIKNKEVSSLIVRPDLTGLSSYPSPYAKNE